MTRMVQRLLWRTTAVGAFWLGAVLSTAGTAAAAITPADAQASVRQALSRDYTQALASQGLTGFHVAITQDQCTGRGSLFACFYGVRASGPSFGTQVCVDGLVKLTVHGRAGSLKIVRKPQCANNVAAAWQQVADLYMSGIARFTMSDIIKMTAASGPEPYVDPNCHGHPAGVYRCAYTSEINYADGSDAWACVGDDFLAWNTRQHVYFLKSFQKPDCLFVPDWSLGAQS